jgi:hypothetical protein
MTMNRLAVGICAAIVLAAGFSFAAKPPLAGHPNLQAARMHLKQAMAKITAAQRANEFDMGGHAAKAKELLEQADQEIGQAAEAANANKK